VTAFTTAWQWTPSSAQLIQSTCSQSTFVRSILILASHLYLGLVSGLFPSCFPRLHVYIFPLSSIRATRSARPILRDLFTRTFGEDYRSWSSSSLLPHPSSSAPNLQRPNLCSSHNLRHPQHTTSQSVLPDDAVPRFQRLLVGSSIADAWTQLLRGLK